MELIFDKLNSMGERIDVMEKNLIDQLSPISNDVQYLKDQLLVRDQKIHELESRLSSFEDEVDRMLKVENSRKVKLFNFPAIGDTYPAVKKISCQFSGYAWYPRSCAGRATHVSSTFVGVTATVNVTFFYCWRYLRRNSRTSFVLTPSRSGSAPRLGFRE